MHNFELVLSVVYSSSVYAILRNEVWSFRKLFAMAFHMQSLTATVHLNHKRI